MSAFRSQMIVGSASSEDHTVKPWLQAILSGDTELARPIPDGKQPFAMKRVVEFIRSFTGLSQLMLMVQWSDVNRPIRYGSAGAHPILTSFNGMWIGGHITPSTNMATNYLFARVINGMMEVLSASISATSTVLNGLVSAALFRVVMSPYQIDPASFPNYDDDAILQQSLAMGVDCRAYPMGNSDYRVPGPNQVNTDVPLSDATYSTRSTAQATVAPPWRVTTSTALTPPTTVWSTCEVGDANPALYISGASKAIEITGSMILTSGSGGQKYFDVIAYYVNGAGALTAMQSTRIFCGLDTAAGNGYSANVNTLFVCDNPIAAVRIIAGGAGLGSLTTGDIRVTEFGLSSVAPVHFVYCSGLDTSTVTQVNTKIAYDVVPNLNLSSEVQGLEQVDQTTHGAYKAAVMLAQQKKRCFTTSAQGTASVLDLAQSSPPLTATQVMEGKASMWDSIGDFMSAAAKPLGHALGETILTGLASDGSSTIEGFASDKEKMPSLTETKVPLQRKTESMAAPSRTYDGSESLIFAFRDDLDPGDLATLFQTPPSQVGTPYLSYYQGRETVVGESKYSEKIQEICPGNWMPYPGTEFKGEHRMVVPRRRGQGPGPGGPRIVIHRTTASAFGPTIVGRASTTEVPDNFFLDDDVTVEEEEKGENPFASAPPSPSPDGGSAFPTPVTAAAVALRRSEPETKSASSSASDLALLDPNAMSLEQLRTLVLQMRAALGARIVPGGSGQSDITHEAVFQARYDAVLASDAGKVRSSFGVGQCAFPLIVVKNGEVGVYTCIAVVTGLPVRGITYTSISSTPSINIASAKGRPQLSQPGDLEAVRRVLTQVQSLRGGTAPFFLTFFVESFEQGQPVLIQNVIVSETSFTMALMLAAMGTKGTVNAVGIVSDIYGPFQKPANAQAKAQWVQDESVKAKRATFIASGGNVEDFTVANKLVMAVKVGRAEHPGYGGKAYSMVVNSLDQIIFWMQVPRTRKEPGKELITQVQLPKYITDKAESMIDPRAREAFLARNRKAMANAMAQAAKKVEAPYRAGTQTNAVTAVEISQFLERILRQGVAAPDALERELIKLGASPDLGRTAKQALIDSARNLGGASRINSENAGGLYRKIAQALQPTKKIKAANKGRSFQMGGEEFML